MLTIREMDGAGPILGSSRADSHEEGAQRWARRAHGRRATAVRVTGVSGLGCSFETAVTVGGPA
jgi:hypothetical protein